MKLLFCYLEHLDSLRLGLAKRQMSWTGLQGLSRPAQRCFTFTFSVKTYEAVTVYIFSERLLEGVIFTDLTLIRVNYSVTTGHVVTVTLDEVGMNTGTEPISETQCISDGNTSKSLSVQMSYTILGTLQKSNSKVVPVFNPLAPELFFFLVLAHPVYKM